jgi:hypothetical protein
VPHWAAPAERLHDDFLGYKPVEALTAIFSDISFHPNIQMNICLPIIQESRREP